MRPIHAKDVWGLTENDAWNEIFYGQLQCPNCYRPCEQPEDFWGTYHVVHPTRADWCLTLRFQFWDERTDPFSCHFKNVELSVGQFLCRPKPGPAPDSRRRSLRLAELRNEVFHWLSRARVDKCQLVCKEWRFGIDWQQRSLALHTGRITIKTVEQARREGQQSEDADGLLTFSIVCRLDDSELVEDRRFHLPHEPQRDSALIRNHLRNFFASSVTLDSMQDEWLPWLRAMFAGLQNCYADSLELFDSTTLGREPRLTRQVVESARPLLPRHLKMELAPTVLDAHLRDGFLSPELLGNFAKVDCYGVSGSVLSAQARDRSRALKTCPARIEFEKRHFLKRVRLASVLGTRRWHHPDRTCLDGRHFFVLATHTSRCGTNGRIRMRNFNGQASPMSCWTSPSNSKPGTRVTLPQPSTSKSSAPAQRLTHQRHTRMWPMSSCTTS
ncbi:hypothetical protein AAVH_37723, partial [Aphelenchoides avenae]